MNTRQYKAFVISAAHMPFLGHISCSACVLWHDDVMKWIHFPRYWPFMRGIHRSPVNSPHTQRPVTRSFDVFFDLRLNKPLSKQWWGRWFEALSRPLWRHCSELWGPTTTLKPRSPLHNLGYTIVDLKISHMMRSNSTTTYFMDFI